MFFSILYVDIVCKLHNIGDGSVIQTNITLEVEEGQLIGLTCEAPRKNKSDLYLIKNRTKVINNAVQCGIFSQHSSTSTCLITERENCTQLHVVFVARTEENGSIFNIRRIKNTPNDMNNEESNFTIAIDITQLQETTTDGLMNTTEDATTSSPGRNNGCTSLLDSNSYSKLIFVSMVTLYWLSTY